VNKEYKKLVEAGITVIVAAGNSLQDAYFFSPASEESVITVGAINQFGIHANFRSGGSNYGSDVDIWAPGVAILSALANTKGYTEKAGTSMACPHVAGVAAQLLERHPHWTPVQVRNALVDMACKYDGERFHGSPSGILKGEPSSLCPFSHGSCDRSSDACLQSWPNWGSSYTCQDSAENGYFRSSYCASYPQEMGLCCAKACSDEAFSVPCVPPSGRTVSCSSSSDSCLQQIAGWEAYTCHSAAEDGFFQASYCKSYPEVMGQCCSQACQDNGFAVPCA
jgi:hypothetical protein